MEQSTPEFNRLVEEVKALVDNLKKCNSYCIKFKIYKIDFLDGVNVKAIENEIMIQEHIRKSLEVVIDKLKHRTECSTKATEVMYFFIVILEWYSL